MGLTRSAIEAMARDQSALKAASALLKPAKWPVRARSGQGSGANPYRVVADTDEHGSKCTCPSRKFPCEHAIALMWLFVEDGATFQDADIPAWVHDWMGRRRKGSAAAASGAAGEAKSLNVARDATADAPPDPKAEERKRAASEKRAQDTRRSAHAATEDLDGWISDQLRTGLAGFLNEAGERCRRIAARLVDAKAGSLASRVDEMPSRLLALPTEQRIDGAIAELGKLALLTRAWRAAPDDGSTIRSIPRPLADSGDNSAAIRAAAVRSNAGTASEDPGCFLPDDVRGETGIVATWRANATNATTPLKAKPGAPRG